MPLDLNLGLRVLPTTPKLCIPLFLISLTILLMTPATTKSTKNLQPLQFKAEADKTILELSALEARGMVGIA